jgi:hypothetical protein
MPGDLATAADDLAKDVVSIATSTHFGGLREDMIINATSKALLGDVTVPAPLRLVLAMAVINRLGIAVAALSDELVSA